MTKKLVAGQVEPGMVVTQLDFNAVQLKVVKVHSSIVDSRVRLAWTLDTGKRYNVKPATVVRVLIGASQ